MSCQATGPRCLFMAQLSIACTPMVIFYWRWPESIRYIELCHCSITEDYIYNWSRNPFTVKVSRHVHNLFIGKQGRKRRHVMYFRTGNSRNIDILLRRRRTPFNCLQMENLFSWHFFFVLISSSSYAAAFRKPIYSPSRREFDLPTHFLRPHPFVQSIKSAETPSPLHAAPTFVQLPGKV